MAIEYVPQALPKAQKIPFSVNLWQGLNRVKGSETSGEMTAMRNMCGDYAPFSAPRKPREVIERDIASPQNLFAAGDKLGYIAEGKLYYDGSLIKDGDGNDVAVGETSAIVDFSGNVVMYPSNVVYDYVNNKAESIIAKHEFTKGPGYYLDHSGAYRNDDAKDNLIWRREGVYNYTAAVFALKANGSEHIDTSNIQRITVNGSDLAPLPAKVTRKVFIVGYDSSDNVVTYRGAQGDRYLIANVGEVINTAEYSKIKVIIGYEKNDRADVNARTADYNNTAAFWYEAEGDYPTAGTPAIQHATVDNNRIFAAQGNGIYASSQGSYSKWNEFADIEGNPDPLGSYHEELDTPQDITGIIKYKGNVVITKPDLVYESFGNKPPYRIIEVAKTGCIDGRSMVEVNSILYWLGRDGIYSYTGGQPRNISVSLGKEFTKGIGGTDGRKYYLSAFDGNGWELYVYDTYTGYWHIEDDTNFVGFAYAGGYMHGLAANGVLYRFGSGDERVEWEFETKDFTFDIPNKKTLSKMYIRVQMGRYTHLDLYIRKDGGEYERRASYHAKEYTVFDFKAKVKKFDSFSLKFSGLGDVRILDIHGDVTVGTSKHRHEDLSVFRG